MVLFYALSAIILLVGIFEPTFEPTFLSRQMALI